MESAGGMIPSRGRDATWIAEKIVLEADHDRQYGGAMLTLLTLANNTVGSPGQGEGNFEIGQILHLNSEIRNLRLDWSV